MRGCFVGLDPSEGTCEAVRFEVLSRGLHGGL